jgi:hypothetical protein
MLLFERPLKPEDFEDRMTPHRERVQREFRAGEKPDFGRSRKATWAFYKAHFASAQGGKCAYCEWHVKAGSHGDVEHFRPKAAVSEIAADPTGSDRDLPPSVHQLSEHGYWWLAFSWENWLLACTLCNRKFKRSLFPVEQRVLPLERDIDKREIPLLLDPCGSISPAANKEEEEAEIIDDLLRMGDVQYNYSGMVRIIVEQELEVSWPDLRRAGST